MSGNIPFMKFYKINNVQVCTGGMEVFPLLLVRLSMGQINNNDKLEVERISN